MESRQNDGEHVLKTLLAEIRYTWKLLALDKHHSHIIDGNFIMTYIVARVAIKP